MYRKDRKEKQKEKEKLKKKIKRKRIHLYWQELIATVDITVRYMVYEKDIVHDENRLDY